MEDLKQIQEFFSKPLNENVYVEAFKLEKALKGMGYDVKVKAVDDFGENVFEIYFNNPADADDDSIFYDAKKLGYDNVRVFANPQESLEEYNSGLYYDPAKERNAIKAKEASKTAMDRIKDMIKKIASEQKMGEALSDYEEKEADYDKLYSDYAYKAVKEVAAQKGFSKYLKSKDNPKGETDGLDTKTMNKILMNVIKDIEETIQLGKNLEEGKLCPKGEAYRKRRMAAGEKSSAYLSGRAVKVCKGQMSGKKKK